MCFSHTPVDFFLVQIMQLAIRDNPFRTLYFCWLDIGLFRDLTVPLPPSPATATVLPPIPAGQRTFHLDLPPKFLDAANDSIAVCEVCTMFSIFEALI